MTQVGYEYRARPNDAAGTGGTWDEWEQWHDQQVAAYPDFDAALFGGADEQIGGCQADAYRAVHGPGEEAYSKAATLENQFRGDIHWLDLDQAAVDQWITEHAEDVARVPRRARRRTTNHANHHRRELLNPRKRTVHETLVG